MSTEHPIDVLKADPANPRVMKPEAATGLGVSMETFDDIAGITWNERTGEFVAGHQRMSQLRAAGATTWRRLSKAEGVITHPKTGARFRIRIVDWDPTKQRAANLVANNPHLQGEFTPEALAQLKAIDDDVDYAGLRLDALQAQLEAGLPEGEPGGGKTDPDAVPELPKVPVTQPGDLWILGDHRLLCGDSTKAADVARLLGREKVILGLHDPPYGIAVQHKDGRIGSAKPWGTTAGRIISAKVYPHIIGDDKPFDPAHLLGSGKKVIIWGANHFAPKLPPSAAWIVWVKRPEMEQNNFSDAELAWVSTGGSVRVFSYVWSGLVRDGKTEEGPVRVHPTQKPIALYAYLIENHSEAASVVYDAYGGSGPTVLASEKLGRKARVMEMHPAYCDVIVTRWEAFTGRKATRQPASKAVTYRDAKLAKPAAPRPPRTGKRRRK